MNTQSTEETQMACCNAPAEETLRDEEWRRGMVRCGGCGGSFDSDQSLKSHIDTEKNDFHYPSSLYSPSEGAVAIASAKKGSWSSGIAALSLDELRTKIHGSKTEFETLP